MRENIFHCGGTLYKIIEEENSMKVAVQIADGSLTERVIVSCFRFFWYMSSVA